MFYGTVLAQSRSERVWPLELNPCEHLAQKFHYECKTLSNQFISFHILCLWNGLKHNRTTHIVIIIIIIIMSLWRQWRRMGNVNLSPLTPNFGTRYSEWSYSRSGHFFPRDPSNRRECGCHMRSGRLGENIILVRVPRIEPRALTLILVIKPSRCTNFSNSFLE